MGNFRIFFQYSCLSLAEYIVLKNYIARISLFSISLLILKEVIYRVTYVFVHKYRKWIGYIRYMVEKQSKSLRAKNLLATLLQLLLCTRIWMPFLTLLSCPPIDLFVKLVYCCFSTTIFPNCFLWTSLIQLERLSRIDRMCQIANHGQQQYLVEFCHLKYHIF